MKTAVAISDGEARLVGQGAVKDYGLDPERYYLHVLPQLYFPYKEGDRIKKPDDLICEITIDEEVMRPEGWQWRRPYPNSSYFVFGTSEMKCGFFVPVDPARRLADVFMSWKIPALKEHVFHHVEIQMEVTDRGKIFSMEVPIFARGFSNVKDAPRRLCSPQTASAESPTDGLVEVPYRVCPLRTVTEQEDLGDDEHIRDRARHNWLSFERRSPAQQTWKEDPWYEVSMYDHALLPSASLADLTFHEHEETRLLRDVERRFVFSSFNEAHESNASIEAAAPEDFGVMVRAIRLAAEVPFGKGTIYEDDYEEHPAQRLLSEWWNERAEETLRCARSAMPWVRVEDADEYWCGYHESPGMPVTDFFERESNARFGNAVILVYLQGREHARPADAPAGWSELPTVAGACYETAGSSLDEYHPAWYSLEALEGFPERFPEAWRDLQEKAAAHTNG